jgi:hypothetical protein
MGMHLLPGNGWIGFSVFYFHTKYYCMVFKDGTLAYFQINPLQYLLRIMVELHDILFKEREQRPKSNNMGVGRVGVE